MAVFKKGHSKAGGRKKGAPNKSSLGVLDKLTANNIDLIDSIIAKLPELEAHKFVDTCLKLMDFVYPRRKAIELTSQGFFRRAVKKLDGTIDEFTNEPDDSDEN